MQSHARPPMFNALLLTTTELLLHTQSQTLASTARTMFLWPPVPRMQRNDNEIFDVYTSVCYHDLASGKLRLLTFGLGSRARLQNVKMVASIVFPHTADALHPPPRRRQLTALQIRSRQEHGHVLGYHLKFGESHKSHSELHSNSWPCSRTHKSISSCQRS